MEGTVERSSTITLKLSEKEATWLKGMVQNYLSYPIDNEENPEDASNRKKFWDTLVSLGV